MNNVEALKALYVKLGGSAEAVENLNTNAEIIAAIAEISSVGDLIISAEQTSSSTVKLSVNYDAIIAAVSAGKTVRCVFTNSDGNVIQMPTCSYFKTNAKKKIVFSAVVNFANGTASGHSIELDNDAADVGRYVNFSFMIT